MCVYVCIYTNKHIYISVFINYTLIYALCAGVHMFVVPY